jgi:hypothetical protein
VLDTVTRTLKPQLVITAAAAAEVQAPYCGVQVLVRGLLLVVLALLSTLSFLDLLSCS